MELSDNTSKLFLLTIIVCVHTLISTEVEPPGHLKKLGSHKDPSGITMIGKFSTPAVFYEHFVKPGKPLWMRSVLSSVNHPGLTNWTDNFFRKHYGSETVKVEISRKENRKSIPKWLTFRQFLSLYETEDVYMVQTLKDKMEELVLIPTSLQCGGFQRAIQEAVMWLGSGNTVSVLHRDGLDNLLCLLDGRKEFVLIDKVYRHEVETHGFVESEGYSLLNTAKVDLIKFPRLASLPWHQVHLDKGDCIFIPKGWYHQVTSHKHRHLAINIWFSHLFWFNYMNCSNDQEFHKPLEPISTFGFATPNEVYRSKLLEDLFDKGFIFKNVFVETVHTSTPERRRQFFDAVDKYKDSVLSWSELYAFDIDKAIAKFPDIFGLPGNSLSRTDEEIILYEPIRVFHDDLVDDDDEEGKDSVVEVHQEKDTLQVTSDDSQNQRLEQFASVVSQDKEPEHQNKWAVSDDTHIKENAHNPQHIISDVSQNKEPEHQTKQVVSDDSQDKETEHETKQVVSDSENKDSPSLLPDDPLVDDALKQDDWLHHDLYRHGYVGEDDDIHNNPEPTQHWYYDYSESEDDLKVHKSDHKDEL